MSCKTRHNFEVSIAGGIEEEGKGQLLLQGNSREMVNIWGGYSICRCERKSSYERMYNSEWMPTFSCLNLQLKKALRNTMRKEKLLTVNLILILI